MGNSAARSMEPKIIGVGSREVVGFSSKFDGAIRIATLVENVFFFDNLNFVSIGQPILWNFSLNNDIIKKTLTTASNQRSRESNALWVSGLSVRTLSTL